MKSTIDVKSMIGRQSSLPVAHNMNALITLPVQDLRDNVTKRMLILIIYEADNIIISVNLVVSYLRYPRYLRVHTYQF